MTWTSFEVKCSLNVKIAKMISLAAATPQVFEAVNNKEWDLLRASQQLLCQNNHLYFKNRRKQAWFSVISFST